MRASIEQRPETLDSGWPAGTGAPTVLYVGPAELASPSKSWEQAAALEGVITGSLIVQSAADLTQATHVVVDSSETYRVASAEREGYVWTLRLRRAA